MNSVSRREIYYCEKEKNEQFFHGKIVSQIMKKALIAIILLCICFSIEGMAYSVESYYEAGKKDTLDEIDEDDQDYNYNKYHLGIENKLSKQTTYSLSYTKGKKDYGLASLNNEYFEIKNKYEYLKIKKGIKRQFALTLNYKEKEFPGAGQNSFSNINSKGWWTYRDPKSHSIKTEVGYQNYRFKNNPGNNEEVISGKIDAKKYLDDLTLGCNSKIIYSTSSLFRTQSNNKVTLDYSSMNLGYGFGYRKGEHDEGEYSNDYKYSEINIGNQYKIGKSLTGSLRYEGTEKGYLSGNYDSVGFGITNGLKYKFSSLFYTKLDLEYRQRLYDNIVNLSHYKNRIEISLNYRERMVWGCEVLLRSIFYRFPSSTTLKDRNDKGIKISVDRYMSDSLKLKLSSQYMVKDYYNAADVNLPSFRVGVEIR